jgi:hypothetical protein
MINSMRRTGVLVLAALTLVVSAGCSSSGGNPATSTSAGSGAPAAGGPPVSAATKKAVEKAFTVFFNSDSKTAQSEAVLQHGAVFHQTLIAQGKTDYAKNTSVKITSVTKVSKNVSAVKFTINSGSIKFPYHGNAVREGGKWKVAAKTLCGLLKVEGGAPSACDKKSITALPH